MEDYPRQPRSRVLRSRLWLSLWMVLAAGAIAIGALPDGSFVPAGVIVVVLVVVYVLVFAARMRRIPKDDSPEEY